ncbi:uncharacterized protein LOC111612396 [Centruroides sculpturatus]|uniref:uncharacterized protein LOC111612396 n=1 Tax=Centruroides sculpturatus TaxID=218467 RepID=UPI000C6EE94C|nr:uncharacterized protein LOC111612396 [Centruroides sculpturatus]
MLKEYKFYFLQTPNNEFLKLKIWLKHSSDSKGFGFSLRGGKDQGTPVFVDSVTPGGASEVAGLKVGDEIREINGESCYGRCHSALVFAVKQAVYTGLLDLVIKRASDSDNIEAKDSQPQIISRRGSAFAQRIAMFNNSIENQSSQDNQKSEPYDFRNKADSIVLRRRSTFETATQNKEQTASNRWSTSVTRDSYSGGFSVQDRKNSFESFATMDHSTEVKSFTSKKLPPPVPAKPKSKMSTSIESIESLHDLSKEAPVESNELPEKKNICMETPKLTESEVLITTTLDTMQLNEIERKEEPEIIKLNEDKNVETLKELCENCLTKSGSPPLEQNAKLDDIEKNNQVNSVNDVQNEIIPCGYSVKVQGDMNIVYESYAHEPSDEICQNDISEESNSNEIADHDTMYITDNNDQQIFTNELNNEVCNLPNQLIDESCKNNEQLSKNENECFFSQVQMTVSDTEICGENVEDNLDIGMNETTSDVNRSEVSSQCNYIESRSTQSDILTPVDDIAEQMELMILNQLAQQNDNVEQDKLTR